MNDSNRKRTTIDQAAPADTQSVFESQMIGSSMKQTDTMVGRVMFHHFPGGLSLHAVDAVEKMDASWFVALPAGLSFNLVFNGKVDFSYGGQRDYIGGDRAQTTCTTLIAEHSEVMTRHTKEGESVRKLNIFVERSWLEARIKHMTSRQQLDHCFQHHSHVYHWHVSSSLYQQSHTIFLQLHSSAHVGEMKLESQIIQLLISYLDEFFAFLSTQSSHLYAPTKRSEPESLREGVDEGLTHDLSLTEIAHTMGMSISTLQRRFKQSYGMRVMEYIRFQRLEKAKKALIKDNLSIGEAAYIAGYNHTSSFISAFKRYFSTSPSDYQKRHLSPGQQD